MFPSHQTAVSWIGRFFDTVGSVLPYISEPALLESIDRVESKTTTNLPSMRSVQALLSIVFAHTLSTLEERSAEPYYRRTLGLLDPRTVYVSSLELCQSPSKRDMSPSLTFCSASIDVTMRLPTKQPAIYGELDVARFSCEDVISAGHPFAISV